MKMKVLPSQTRLKELFEYDYETGNLIWKIKPATQIKIGAVAGCVRKDGYRTIRIGGVAYQAHRLIWCWHYGPIQTGLVIDHIVSRIPQNNHIENIRAITQQENIHKKSMQVNNTSGSKGVYWKKAVNKWASQIQLKNKKVHLGYYTNIESAADAYDQAAIKYFGEFAATNQSQYIQ